MKSPFAQSELVQPATCRSRNYRIFSEKLSWGALPDGFTRVVDKRGHRLVVRQDQVAHIDFSLCDNDRAGALADSRYHGRGVLRSIVLPDGDTALIRAYRHGGLFRTIATTWFFTWPPRPFRELAVTEELRRRGLRTVEVCAACVSRPAGPFYRGWLITKQLQGAEDLWSAFHSGLIERIGLTAALRAVAGGIRAMHREGVYHADLNLKNILLRIENGAAASYIIDYDRARLFLGRLPIALANRNLARLKRSVLKLDPEQRYFSAAAWCELVKFYHEDRHA